MPRDRKHFDPDMDFIRGREHCPRNVRKQFIITDEDDIMESLRDICRALYHGFTVIIQVDTTSNSENAQLLMEQLMSYIEQIIRRHHLKPFHRTRVCFQHHHGHRD